MGLSNKEAIDMIRNHMDWSFKSCPGPTNRVLHLAECLEKLKTWLDKEIHNFPDGHWKDALRDVALQIKHLESPPKKDPLDELEEWFKEQVHGVSLWQIIDKISELRGKK